MCHVCVVFQIADCSGSARLKSSIFSIGSNLIVLINQFSQSGRIGRTKPIKEPATVDNEGFELMAKGSQMAGIIQPLEHYIVFSDQHFGQAGIFHLKIPSLLMR